MPPKKKTKATKNVLPSVPLEGVSSIVDMEAILEAVGQQPKASGLPALNEESENHVLFDSPTSSDAEETSSASSSEEESEEGDIGEEELALARKAIEEYKKARAEAKNGERSREERRLAFESDEIVTTQRTQKTVDDVTPQLLTSLTSIEGDLLPLQKSDNQLQPIVSNIIKPFALRSLGAKGTTSADLGLSSEHPIPLPFVNGGKRLAEAGLRAGSGAELLTAETSEESLVAKWARRDDSRLILSFLTSGNRFNCLLECVKEISQTMGEDVIPPNVPNAQEGGRGKTLDELLQKTLLKVVGQKEKRFVVAQPLFSSLHQRKSDDVIDTALTKTTSNINSNSGITSQSNNYKMSQHRFSFVGSKRSRDEDIYLQGLFREEDEGPEVFTEPTTVAPAYATQLTQPLTATTTKRMAAASSVMSAADLPSTQRAVPTQQHAPSSQSAIGNFLEKGDFIAKAQWAEYQRELLIERKNKEALERAAQRRSKTKR